MFEHTTDADLQKLHAERYQPEGNEKRNWIAPDTFVVLDERSADDKTVLVHALRTLFNDADDEVDGDITDVEPEVIGETWYVWRVPMPQCKYWPLSERDEHNKAVELVGNFGGVASPS